MPLCMRKGDPWVAFFLCCGVNPLCDFGEGVQPFYVFARRLLSRIEAMKIEVRR